jgi:Na+-transporting NADH:ubiquinone oxidoreductase subunit NqrD
MFCSIKIILGTIKRILKVVLVVVVVVVVEEYLEATLFAHSKAISVLPVPVLYTIVPLQSLSIHAFTASI